MLENELFAFLVWRFEIIFDHCNFIVTCRCFDTMLQGKKTVTFRLIVIYLKYEIYDLKHLIKPVLASGPSCAYQKTPRVTWVEDI